MVNLHLLDRMPAYGEPLVFPNRSDMTHPAYPIGICTTCHNDTKEYDQSLCERCAEGYTNAFYKISYEQFGIKVKGVKYVQSNN